MQKKEASKTETKKQIEETKEKQKSAAKEIQKADITKKEKIEEEKPKVEIKQKTAEEKTKAVETKEEAQSAKPAAATKATISAEELAKEFKEHSVAEFFKKNSQMLGLYGKVRTLTTIVHEYCTNSLDACEAAKILPEIDIKIEELGPEYYEVTVKDNGPGLTKETVGKALGKLLAGTKFHRMVQSRGQQGIGASGVTLFSQVTTGKQVKVITGTGKGKTLSLELTIDPKRNEPKIMELKETEKDFRGLAVKAKFKEVLYRVSEQGPLEYLRRTAIANPHAEIYFTDPLGEKTIFKRSLKEIPLPAEPIQPHPKGVTVDELITMAKYSPARKLNSFLKNEFDRMGDKAIGDIAKKVSFDLNKDPKKLEWAEAEEIVKCFKEIDFIAPRVDALRPIGENQIATSLKSIVKPEFLSVITRKPQVYKGGFPFQVEVGVAFGGEAGRITNNNNKEEEKGGSGRTMEIMRFANRAPLLFDGGACAITKAVQTIEWKRYGIISPENAPLTVFINFSSVYVPYTSAGKQAIADEEEIVEELRLALMDAGRKIAHYVMGKRKEKEKQEKKKLFMKYATEVAYAVGELAEKSKEEIEKKLLNIVLKKLKLDEQKEKELEEMGEEEIEKELEKEAKKAEKEKKKGKKGKTKAVNGEEESE